MIKTLAVRLDEFGMLDWSRVKQSFIKAKKAEYLRQGYTVGEVKAVERWTDSRILRSILSKLAWPAKNSTPAK